MVSEIKILLHKTTDARKRPVLPEVISGKDKTFRAFGEQAANLYLSMVCTEGKIPIDMGNYMSIDFYRIWAYCKKRHRGIKGSGTRIKLCSDPAQN